MAKTASKRGRDAEKKTAKRMKGKTMPASGATWHSKGDFEANGFLFDNKETAKRSFTVSEEMWRKIWFFATKRNLFPALAIQINGAKTPMRLVVIEEEMFTRLASAWEEYT